MAIAWRCDLTLDLTVFQNAEVVFAASSCINLLKKHFDLSDRFFNRFAEDLRGFENLAGLTRQNRYVKNHPQFQIKKRP
jgi:hypothetical protein